jgi:CubicO group peptidase (beta-lactamase class C family)
MNSLQKMLIVLPVLAASSAMPSLVFAATPSEPTTSALALKPFNIENLERVLNSKLIEQFSPGLSVAVVADGNIILSKGFGKTLISGSIAVTPDTPFYIASSTKAFTAHISSDLARSRPHLMTTPLQKLMPTLRFHPNVNTEQVTLQSLLNHTHGISGDGPVTYRTAFTGEFQSAQDLLALLPHHLASAAGNSFEYSNLGPVLAGYILEHLTGKAWQDLVDEKVFKPLNMHNSANRLTQLDPQKIAQGHEFSGDAFVISKAKKIDKNMHAAGGTYSSANDLAAWLGVHLQQGRWQEKTIFPSELIANAWKQTASQNRTVGGMKRVGWSLGWDIAEYKGQRIYLRPGGFTGYSAHISMMPERGFGVVVLSNGGQLSGMMNQHIVDVIYGSLLNEADHDARRVEAENKLQANYAKMIQAQLEEKQKRVARQQPLPLPMASYAGTFENELGTLQCQIKDNQLILKMGIAEADTEVFKAEEHAFRTELLGRGQILTYVMKDGKVTGLNLGEKYFMKTN